VGTNSVTNCYKRKCTEHNKDYSKYRHLFIYFFSAAAFNKVMRSDRILLLNEAENEDTVQNAVIQLNLYCSYVVTTQCPKGFIGLQLQGGNNGISYDDDDQQPTFKSPRPQPCSFFQRVE
jgi:hypothetical protein